MEFKPEVEVVRLADIKFVSGRRIQDVDTVLLHKRLVRVKKKPLRMRGALVVAFVSSKRLRYPAPKAGEPTTYGLIPSGYIPGPL